MATRILLVEDDPDTSEIVQCYLENEGYQVLLAADGWQALRQVEDGRPDLVILDLMLPKMDGLEVCQAIRREAWTPIIMLTARVDEDSRLEGLNLGADDYISKPFSPREVVARVKAVLRRSDPLSMDGQSMQLSYSGIDVNLKDHQVTVDDLPVALTPTELRLLVLLVRSPNRVFTREHIMSRVFNRDSDSLDRSVDTHVSNLRRKLNAASAERQYIQTVYGVGYRLHHD